MVKTVLRKVNKTAPDASGPVIDTSSSPVDENAADRLIQEIEGASGTPAQSENLAVTASVPAVISKYSDVSAGGLEGEFDQSDFKLPQLKIVNGSGPLSKEYNQGTLLYADEELWGPPDVKDTSKNPKMLIVSVKIVKQFRENLTQDEIAEGNMPRIVSSREEAEFLGGSTRRVGQEKPRWSPSAKVIFLLQEPDGSAHPAFSTSLDGKNYAPAVFYASGTSYGETAKAIFNAAQMSLKENNRICLHKKFWQFQVVKKQSGQYMVFVPSLRLLRDETGPELREFVNQFNGSSSATQVD